MNVFFPLFAIGDKKMPNPNPKTFIVDCPRCKAKVAAIEHGCIEKPGGTEPDYSEIYYGIRVFLGECPRCHKILVGESQQVRIEGYDSEENEWAEPVRVYPEPPRIFTSKRIPKVVTDSIIEADKSFQASANIAACAMFGRALEAVCHNLLEPTEEKTVKQGKLPSSPPKPPLMLGRGIRKLKENGFIDQRLFDWSQQLHWFRNMAAHPTEIKISRVDAEDLRSFVYAIIEYTYDLTDKYNEFKERQERKAKAKRKKT